jgi:IMP dehydrogenase
MKRHENKENKLSQGKSSISQALTFDDVLLVPAYADFLPHQVSLKTRLTPTIELNTPLISAAMDTVTTAQMAIAIAHEGGVGIIHKNLSVEQQTEQVKRVKKFESGVISEPITLSPDRTVRQALDLAHSKGISGFPVIQDNTLIGIVTKRDLRYVEDQQIPITEVMTIRDKLIVVEEDKSTPETQRQLLHKHRIERLLVVNNLEDFSLTGMITVKDIEQSERFPSSCRDQYGHLRVGAAIGVGDSRYQALIEAGVDVLVIDTAHGHSQGVIEQIKRVKNCCQKTQVIAGNIATAEAALALVDAGANAVKVGIGPGSICTTRIVAGVGFPQITAIQQIAQALEGRQVGIIADGGIRFSGDIGKAIVAGADAVMIGSLFAGTEEAPGEIEYYQGRPYKVYRGMGSMGAMSDKYGSADRYSQSGTESSKLVPEGIEGRVPYKGSVHPVIHQLLGGLQACMGYTGCASIEKLKTQVKMIQLTHAGMIESHVHDVSITKEAPNYRV